MWRYIKALRVLWPKNLSWRQLVMAGVVVGLIVGAFCFGRMGNQNLAKAQSAQPGFVKANDVDIWEATQAHNASTIIALVNHKIPITRQDFGDYLIDRIGSERLDFMINRKIVEHACQAKGIQISQADMENQLLLELKLMKVPSLETFEKTILKPRGKSLYEYMEDVIRPKLAMKHLCENQIQVTPDEVKDAFEAQYGDKVQCRIIVFTKESVRNAGIVWADLQNDKDDAKFTKYAREINPPPLNAEGGKVPPIHRHFPNKEIEKQAFSLKPGEISSCIDMPAEQGMPKDSGSTVILKCDKLIPKDGSHRLEDEWKTLEREVFDRKLAEAMPNMFKALRDEAKPTVMLPKQELESAMKHRINARLAQELSANNPTKAMPGEPVPPPLPTGAGLKYQP